MSTQSTSQFQGKRGKGCGTQRVVGTLGSEGEQHKVQDTQRQQQQLGAHMGLAAIQHLGKFLLFSASVSPIGVIIPTTQGCCED